MAINGSIVLCTDLCGKNYLSNATNGGAPCMNNGTLYNNCRSACLNPSYFFLSKDTFGFCAQNFFQAAPVKGNKKNITCDLTYVNQALNLTRACLEQYCDIPDIGLGGCPSNMTLNATEVCMYSFDNGVERGHCWNSLGHAMIS